MIETRYTILKNFDQNSKIMIEIFIYTYLDKSWSR